ncbi:hypothetical protein IWX90DRAFT_119994 [Phyllosticta citrichinensis]|uniref:Uncharacterized protein n=1 Tax=Phyllosticta citrichinensis TaxID=1130410 RepID=A0ABR1Y3U4_9PEZI
MRLSFRSSMLLSIILILSTLTISSSAFDIAAKEQDAGKSKPKGGNPNTVCRADQASRWRAEIAHSQNDDQPRCKDAPHRDRCDQCVIGYAGAMTACIVACCLTIEIPPAVAICITGCIGAYTSSVGACFSR